MRVLALVTARGRSKGFPGKNVALLGGRPLVAWSYRVLTELRSRRPNVDIFLSTDDPTIALAWPEGARPSRLRPAELAGDATTSMEVVQYELAAAEQVGRFYDAVLLLQPTSPLLTVDDLDAMMEVIVQGAGAGIGIAQTEHPVDWAVRPDAAGMLRYVVEKAQEGRRQTIEVAYIPVGIYVARTSMLRESGSFMVPGITRGVIIPHSRSIDIDRDTDLTVAAQYLAQRGSTASIRIGDRLIGGNAPCFIIAEAGVNHNGDSALARQLIDVAVDAGADAVKFQTFDPELVASSAAPKAEYQSARTDEHESQLEMLRRLALPNAVFADLAAYAAERGIMFLSTAFDAASAKFLESLGVAAFKIPSGELTNHPFVAQHASMGKPLLVSTGMATLDEVEAALDVIRASGNPPVALFHCVTNYPAAAADCNLLAIETMRDIFGVPVGWSDHTEGWTISLAAVAQRASILEKHFTTDRGLPGPDHAASLEPDELRTMIRAIRNVEAARGDGVKRPVPSELLLAQVARRSLHAARDLPLGHRVAADDFLALRPATGVSPARLEQIVGRPLLIGLKRGEPLTEAHVT